MLLARLSGLVSGQASGPAACSALMKVSRSFAAAPQEETDTNDETFTVKVHDFKAHMIDPPSTEVQTSAKELLNMFRLMFLMRRMELTADMLYKQKLARGFLHLADGQEAVPVGMEASLTKKDSIIQSYRDHCTFVGRGGTPHEVFAELLGKKTGAARGLGGSMHLYKPENGFYGGCGIVGTHVPNGAGLGFAHKYRKEPNVAVAIYGDGAANQGQVAEAYNLSAVWSLPVLFVVENNHFGMGTSERRAAKATEFYKRGDYIPGIWVDGMDALAVKQATAHAKQYAIDNGPILLEMDTYRYHGHSISDPGSSYRTRDEVQGVRRARDPIDHIRKLLVDHNILEQNDLKKMEREIKKEIDESLKKAKSDAEPPIEDLWNNIYVDGLHAQLQPIETSLPKIQL